MNSESLGNWIRESIDGGATLKVRRPGHIFQVELPAFAGDGDGREIYLEPQTNGSVNVTDLGSTRMRLSYTRKVSEELDEQVRKIASSNGLELEEGALCAVVGRADLAAAILGLLQAEAQIEVATRQVRRTPSLTGEFREAVESLLRELFGSKVTFPFVNTSDDPEGLYQLDARIELGQSTGIALISGDTEAERRVSAKLHLEKSAAPNTRWLAIPQNMNALSTQGRKRVLREFVSVGHTFEEEKPGMKKRLTYNRSAMSMRRADKMPSHAATKIAL